MLHPGCVITNTLLSINDPAWMQASLPVKSGGLGIRSALTLAPSAFLAPASSAYALIDQIIPDSLHHANYPSFDTGLEVWSRGHSSPPPSDSEFSKQVMG